jgi:hypothetical protein
MDFSTKHGFPKVTAGDSAVKRRPVSGNTGMQGTTKKTLGERSRFFFKAVISGS